MERISKEADRLKKQGYRIASVHRDREEAKSELRSWRKVGYYAAIRKSLGYYPYDVWVKRRKI